MKKCLLCDEEFSDWDHLGTHYNKEHVLYRAIEGVSYKTGKDATGPLYAAQCPVCSELITEDTGDRQWRLGYRFMQHIHGKDSTDHAIALLMILDWKAKPCP